jgi:hypothetical protein
MITTRETKETSVDENVEKLGPSFTIGGTAKFCHCCGKQKTTQ